jgi:hypothetical protein
LLGFKTTIFDSDVQLSFEKPASTARTTFESRQGLVLQFWKAFGKFKSF